MTGLDSRALLFGRWKHPGDEGTRRVRRVRSRWRPRRYDPEFVSPMVRTMLEGPGHTMDVAQRPMSAVTPSER